MKLSDEELGYVKVCRSRQRSWYWLRWFALGGTILGIALFVSLLWQMFDFVEEYPSLDTVLSIALFLAPLCWGILFMNIWAFVWTVIYWNGDPKSQLLLRLVEEESRSVTNTSKPESRSGAESD